ncbi:magnesium-dependent phosphatase-1 [Punctularia strigosozonata HHB-11173 SS5]|uniref:magnesium-dependent phosphatase-1 n=1 Tax=Punctularia strigosozonata (strain HHB-11173) TaxID=741275 RepID=UPI0004416BA9|nr:magnesium-dependent phosphatase-1 [Punctularia strigosozonata HHB-11173 SS5]EIN06516.1 magnesium-dependent phosphatase-1 [Punctularia strigosozonata HHB-11173 SS5]
MTSRLPKLVAFDLDYTLWDLWVDTHVTPPLKRNGNALNEVKDKYGETIAFYRDVPSILHRLRDAGVTIAAASRTSAPRVARQALDLLLVPPKPGDKDGAPTRAIQFFDEMEIYPGSKITHFKKLHERTGIDYAEMLFFDDESRNREVSNLGVTFCLVRDGLNDRTFEHGLADWRKQHPELVVEDAAGQSAEE